MTTIAVIGDTHTELAQARDLLLAAEIRCGRKFAHVFSVGDLGLFLSAQDWNFLTGPKKHRHPERSEELRAVWEAWPWPTSQIAGNHEPFNRLRDWQPEYFGGKLSYTHAGAVPHDIPGLRVAGLSGILHPEHLDFQTIEERRTQICNAPCPQSWAHMVELVRKGHITPKRLTYYHEDEIELVKSLPRHPHLLLTHDWPVKPAYAREVHPRRPEGEILDALQPQFAC
ncbi:MAG: hypothetical protein SNJ52_01475 [Verrucomicrobiia bacterium]